MINNENMWINLIIRFIVNYIIIYYGLKFIFNIRKYPKFMTYYKYMKITDKCKFYNIVLIIERLSTLGVVKLVFIDDRKVIFSDSSNWMFKNFYYFEVDHPSQLYYRSVFHPLMRNERKAMLVKNFFLIVQKEDELK